MISDGIRVFKRASDWRNSKMNCCWWLYVYSGRRHGAHNHGGGLSVFREGEMNSAVYLNVQFGSSSEIFNQHLPNSENVRKVMNLYSVR